MADAPRPRRSAEALIDIVIAADAARRKALGHELSRFRAWQRYVIEPPFNLLGLLVGQLILWLPKPRRDAFILWICRILARRSSSVDAAASATEARRLAQRLSAESGAWPAVFIWTTHAPTSGPLEWLRFELLAYGLRVGLATAADGQAAGWPARTPQAFLAIDPFALDTLPAPVAGFYAGVMHRIFIAWDRQPSTQGWLQRHLLLRGADHTHIAWRLLRRLRARVPVVMVLGGGLPQNARLLYGARELVARLPRRAMSRQFIELRLLTALAGLEGGDRPAEEGRLSAAVRATVLRLLEEAGVAPTEREAWLMELEREFLRAVPYRARLFRVLIARLVRRGVPVLWMGLSHEAADPHVRATPAWGCYRDAQGRLWVVDGAQAAPRPLETAAALAERFGAFFA